MLYIYIYICIYIYIWEREERKGQAVSVSSLLEEITTSEAMEQHNGEGHSWGAQVAILTLSYQSPGLGHELSASVCPCVKAGMMVSFECQLDQTVVPGYFVNICFYLFILLHQISVAACRIFNCRMQTLFLFFSSTTLLLPTLLPPPSCTHAQSCNPMDCSPPGSSVHGLFQARILEWVAISFSTACKLLTCTCGNPAPWPGLEPRPPILEVRQSLSHWTTREIARLFNQTLIYVLLWKYCVDMFNSYNPLTLNEGNYSQYCEWCCSSAQSCPYLCDPMDCCTPGFPVLHHLPKLGQPYVHWVGDGIQPAHPLHPLLLLSSIFPSIGIFSNESALQSGGQSNGASTSASVLPMNIQAWSPLGWTGLISLQSKGLSRVFSNTTLQKHRFFSTQPSLWSISSNKVNNFMNQN